MTTERPMAEAAVVGPSGGAELSVGLTVGLAVVANFV
jgi:hypothetical protein